MELKKLSLCAVLGLAVSPLVVADEADTWPISYKSAGVEVSRNFVARGESSEDNLRHFNHYAITGEIVGESGFGLFLQGGFAEPETTVSNSDVNFRRFSVGVRKHAEEMRLQNWRPFAGVGYSRSNIDVNGTSFDGHENAAYIEGGIQRLINERFIAEVGIRGRTDFEDAFIDGEPFVGIRYLFGAEYAEIALDSDNDGVVDGVDQCPNTPAGAPVDKKGCALDGDKDGVFDNVDECPDTPAGALVDKKGCALTLEETIRQSLYIEFETDRSVVNRNSYSDIEKVATVLRQFPATEILLEGHTDSVGSSRYNLALSKSRAAAVKKVLVEEFDIASNRIKTIGYGESKPIASNQTAAGRAQNRRVETIVSAVTKKTIFTNK